MYPSRRPCAPIIDSLKETESDKQREVCTCALNGILRRRNKRTLAEPVDILIELLRNTKITWVPLWINTEGEIASLKGTHQIGGFRIGYALAECFVVHQCTPVRARALGAPSTHRETDRGPCGLQRVQVYVRNALLVFSHGALRRPSFFLALSAAGQATHPSVNHATCLDPGRAPWRCSEYPTSPSCLFLKGVAFRVAAQAEQVHGKPDPTWVLK